jgi:proteasome assembly chaperone (PAC2) family protein
MININNLKNDDIIWFEKPRLIHPYLIVGYEGWSDAGKVSSSVLSYLNSKFSPVLFAKFEPKNYFFIHSGNHENTRPKTVIENGIVKSLEVFTTGLGYVRDTSVQHDLILMYGPEPEQLWDKYVQTVLKIVKMFKVEKTITIGGTFDAIPHTVPTKITASISDQYLQDEIKKNDVELSNYTGPSSIHSQLVMAAAKDKLSMINLWGHTPHYIQVPNMIGCYHLLKIVKSIFGLNLDLEESKLAAERLKNQIDQAISTQPELKKYLSVIEMGYRKEKDGHKQTINQNLVKEIEKLLNNKLD